MAGRTRAQAVPDLGRQRVAVAVAAAAVTLPYTTPQALGLGGLLGIAADLGLLALLAGIAFFLGPDLHTLDYSEPGWGGERDEVLHSRAAAVLAGIVVGVALGFGVAAVA